MKTTILFLQFYSFKKVKNGCQKQKKWYNYYAIDLRNR